jgi:hypothetical protein
MKYIFFILLIFNLLLACEEEEKQFFPETASVKIERIELPRHRVIGVVWESVEKITFSIEELDGELINLGDWQNPIPKADSYQYVDFEFVIPEKYHNQRGLTVVADDGNMVTKKRLFTPQVYISSLYINHILTEDAFNRIWPQSAKYVAGVKAWDGKINYVSQDNLRQWSNSLRKKHMKLCFEKGRWPLPPDMTEKYIEKEVCELRNKDDNRSEELMRMEIIDKMIEDRGESLSTDNYEELFTSKRDEFIRKAAAPDLARLRKIQAAGGLDVFEAIEFDGAIIKNVFPYTTGITQWSLAIPEEDRFKPGFASAEQFLDVLSDMIIYIRNELGEEGKHIQFRLLINFHFWTYGEPVVPEQKPDGSWLYHNVSFHRFREHTLDLKHVVEYIKEKPEIFAGITTDFPYELYRQSAANARYGRMVDDLKNYGISLRPIVNAMSASSKDMPGYHEDMLSFFNQMEREASPGNYMIQSWGIHPTVNELKDPETKPGSWLNAVYKIVNILN